MAGAVGSASSFRDAVERLVAGGMQTYETDAEWIPMFIEFWAQATHEEYARKVVAGSLRECRGLVAGMLGIGQAGGLVRADLDVEAAAVILMGTFDGAAFQWAIDREAVDLQRLEKPMADLIDRFIRGEGEAELQAIDQPLAALFEKFMSERQHDPEGGTP